MIASEPPAGGLPRGGVIRRRWRSVIGTITCVQGAAQTVRLSSAVSFEIRTGRPVTSQGREAAYRDGSVVAALTP